MRIANAYKAMALFFLEEKSDKEEDKWETKPFEMVERDVVVEDILKEANLRIVEDKKPLVMYKNIAKSEELIRRNIKLMKLDNKMLSIGQVQNVSRIIKEFKPQYNKIKFWKTYLDLELDGLDVENLCNNFHFLTYSA